MSALLKKLTTANSHRVSSTTKQSIQTQCNYADNYYGDHRDLHKEYRRQRQMCIRDSFNSALISLSLLS